MSNKPTLWWLHHKIQTWTKSMMHHRVLIMWTQNGIWKILNPFGLSVDHWWSYKNIKRHIDRKGNRSHLTTGLFASSSSKMFPSSGTWKKMSVCNFTQLSVRCTRGKRWRFCCKICAWAQRSYLHSHQQHTETLTMKHVHEVHYAPWQEIRAMPCYLPTQDGKVAQQMVRYSC